MKRFGLLRPPDFAHAAYSQQLDQPIRTHAGERHLDCALAYSVVTGSIGHARFLQGNTGTEHCGLPQTQPNEVKRTKAEKLSHDKEGLPRTQLDTRESGFRPSSARIICFSSISAS